MNIIQVREYAKLMRSSISSKGTLDEAYISDAVFEFLAELIKQEKLVGKIFLDHIKLDSQVGYLEAVDIGIEILPKTALHAQEHELDQLRYFLQEMISVVVQVQSKEVGSAHLIRNSLPLHEWIYQQFLNELKILFRKGLKSDYERVDRTEKFMRGRLDTHQMIQRAAGKDHLFPIEYDRFNFNRLENRLIKTALSYVFKHTQDRDNWRVGNELMKRLSGLEKVHNGHLKLRYWQDHQLMKSYRDILPWCTLILEKMNPHFQKGTHKGITLLFPMERLFEAYVGDYLKKNYVNYYVQTQKHEYHLTKHKGRGFFQLKPDFVLRSKESNEVIIVDTKWKLLDQSEGVTIHQYGILQSDFYQMLAYGYQYQKNKQDCQKILLIYPYSESFQQALPVFQFHEEELNLWVVPFKLWSCAKDKKGIKVDQNILFLE